MRGSVVWEFIRCLRVRQWTKNLLLFAALVFAGRAADSTAALKSIAGFVLFSLAAGTVYIVNDIHDRDSDRNHPVKKHRPIAAGAISPAAAAIGAVFIGGASVLLSFVLEPSFGIAVLAYLVLQELYTWRIKHMVILDVFAVSAGFVLRVVAGALVIGVAVSNWILSCTMLLALFLALSKRRHELTLLEATANNHRRTLDEYSPYLLDQMIGVVTSATLVAYLIFTLSDETVYKFGHMVLTVPFVLYGIFRYLYLVHIKHKGGQPEEILLTDGPLLAAVTFYGIAVFLIVYF